ANHQTHFVDKPTELLKILATNKALKEKFDQLPFKGIVIERNGHIPKGLQSLVDAYGSGPNPKIIKVQEGTLFEGILEAIKNYQSQDAKFAALMNNELKAS
ncbi:hypothetical protein, partial [Glaesserella parasuis]|uniref:hypothetical protein n=1 Tax=Glaesserella parasuis TaxID=738 RepID=UPI003F37EE94